MKTDDELRELLRQYTAINDNYVTMLAKKDEAIQGYVEKTNGLQRRIDELENAYGVPGKAEVSE